MDYFATFLSSFSFMLCYVCLLPERMKLRWYGLLLVFVFFVDTVCSPLGQYGTFLLLAGDILIISLGCRQKLLSVILSLCGQLLYVLIDHALTIPMDYLGCTIAMIQEYYLAVYSLVMTALMLLFSSILRRKFIYPKLSVFQSCPDKVLFTLLLSLIIGISLLGVNFIYGESVDYPFEVLSLNGLIITILTLSVVLVFYNIYGVLAKNHELSLQKAEAEIMQDYTKRMEQFYEDIRIFRHDYRNILATMQDYIDTGNLPALQTYYHDKILSDTELLSDDGFILGKLHLLEDSAVKSLLYTKIIRLLNQKLSFELELSQSIPVLPVDSVLLCRILGILMDNAMEAALESEEKQMRLALFLDGNSTIFIISNSTPPLATPLSELAKPGYSSKKGHSGLGLSSAEKALEKLPNVLLSTEFEGNTFRQVLTICNNSEPCKF